MIANQILTNSILLLILVTIILQLTKADRELLPSNITNGDNGHLLSSSLSSSTTTATAFRDSPLLRSRKRILPAATTTSNSGRNHHHHHNNNNHLHDPHSSISSPSIVSSIVQNNQDFITDRVKMSLECRPKSMLLSMNFTEPFRGVVSVGKSSYSNNNNNNNPEESTSTSTSCSLRGDGRQTYSLEVFHNSCLTQFDKKHGQFLNTLFVRYHPTLEIGGDYSKTLICKFGLVDFSVN